MNSKNGKFSYVPSSCIKVIQLVDKLYVARANEPKYKPMGVITQRVDIDWQVIPISFIAGVTEPRMLPEALCFPLKDFYVLTVHNLSKRVLMFFYECFGLEDERSQFLNDMTFSPDIGWKVPHHPFNPEEVLDVVDAFIEEGVYDAYLDQQAK